MKTISKFYKLDQVKGRLKISSGHKTKYFEACVKGKQVKSSFHSKYFIYTKISLYLLHIDLFSPVT